jgi:hypothetical protein
MLNVDVGDSIKRAAVLRQQGDYDEADQLIAGLLDGNPHDLALWNEYGNIASAQ